MYVCIYVYMYICIYMYICVVTPLNYIVRACIQYSYNTVIYSVFVC